MAINFPIIPELDDTFTNGDNTWVWTGSTWEILPVDTPSFVGLTVSSIIDGEVNSIANHNLDGLGNVNAVNPTDGAVLGYSLTDGQWVPLTLSSTFNGGSITNPLFINNTTVSSSTGTGALRVVGGIGVGGGVNVGTYVSATSYVEIKNSNELRLNDGDNSNYVGFKSPGAVATNKIYVLPAADGDPGQFLQTDGAGNLIWAAGGSGGGGGGSTPPGGSSTQIQFNNSGLFAGNAALTFNAADSILSVPAVSQTGNFTTTGFITSTSTEASVDIGSGVIVIDGGMGMAGQLNVGGNTNKFTATTASTSTTSGAVVVAGGVGVGGAMTVGGNITAATAPTDSSHVANKSYVDTNVTAFSIAFGV